MLEVPELTLSWPAGHIQYVPLVTKELSNWFSASKGLTVVESWYFAAEVTTVIWSSGYNFNLIFLSFLLTINSTYFRYIICSMQIYILRCHKVSCFWFLCVLYYNIWHFPFLTQLSRLVRSSQCVCVCVCVQTFSTPWNWTSDLHKIRNELWISQIVKLGRYWRHLISTPDITYYNKFPNVCSLFFAATVL
jgi:hypothetical protein